MIRLRVVLLMLATWLATVTVSPVVHAGSHVYDGPSCSRVDVDAPAVNDCAPPQLGSPVDSWVGRLLVARRTATSPHSLVNATNTGGGMLGENGTQFVSQTLHTTADYHIDVENPAPGVRVGQLHIRDYSGNKYLYDFDTCEFIGIPRSLAKNLGNDPKVAAAIAKGARYLGL